MYKIAPVQKKYALVIPVLFVISAILGGCASGLTGYHRSLRTKIDSGDYEGAARFVDESKDKYGSSNILMYYLDSGTTNHFAKDYNTSSKRFELAKEKFAQYYQKSITAGAASMFFNDSTMPYYGQDFERIHISVFEALDYILSGRNNEAVVEARQADTLFKTLGTEKNYKNFYKDDGFIRYFMGLVYENAGCINDAHISYFKALKAYRDGLAQLPAPKELIDEAYTSALVLGMQDRAAQIKKEYPKACKRVIPEAYGECIVIDYNGFVPEKIDNVLEFALFDIWNYVDSAQVDSQEQEDFDRAKSIDISVFAKDYIKVAFPKYKDIKNEVVAFEVQSSKQETKSVVVQDIGKIAKACLDDAVAKIYAKTLARAAVKYAIGKSVSSEISDKAGAGWETLSRISFNVFNSLSETSDKRAWNTLPDKILMARFYLPAGVHTLKINFLDKYGEVLDSCNAEVDIKAAKKNFVAVRSSKIGR
jgi:hypothetical protein